MNVEVKIFRQGAELDIICYKPDVSTDLVASKLLTAYGSGILKQGKFGIETKTLAAGDYVYHVTNQSK